MANIISYNQLIEFFKAFADAHPQVNDFGSGPTSEIGTSRQMKFPYLWVTHRGPSNLELSANRVQTPQMNLAFIFVDQLNNQTNYLDINGQDSNNEQEVLSDQFQIAQDFVNYILTTLNKFGVNIREQGASIEPVYDETPDVASGWVLDLILTLKHSNCVTPLGDVDINVPVTPPPITGRYLTCDTLSGCLTFTDAIDNLQEQINNIVISGGSLTCETLIDCTVIQDIQADIIAISGSTGVDCNALTGCTVIQDIQQDITNIEGDVLSLSGAVTTLQTDFYIAVNFIDVETFSYVAPETFRIDTITNPSALSLTILVNAVPYVLGNTITFLDTLTITPNAIGFIKLNCTLV